MAQVIDHKEQLTDLHLKGIGLTPYSRMGDGRAVLRSTIREYLCGHAMTHLGVPSSNALGFVVSDTPVRRERMEQGAALMRVADSHVRLGHIEWIASFAPELLEIFTDFMIDTYYPECRDPDSPTKTIQAFLTQVIERTARLIADWQLVGFAHGVMNTDNLSITGSTIDYGPFGFMERFNPAWINNHSDHTGRYSYQNQPAIGYWNLSIWLPHFLRLSHWGVDRALLDECLTHYEPAFMAHYQIGLCNKLGLPHTQESLNIAFAWLTLIEENQLDYSNSFRALLGLIAGNAVDADNSSSNDFAYEKTLANAISHQLHGEALHAWQEWKQEYLTAIQQHAQSVGMANIIDTLTQHNPVYILRNHMAQRAIEQAENGDFSEVDRLYQLLANPYQRQAIATTADTTPPAVDAPALSISCSS